MPADLEHEKEAAARAALRRVRPGMRLALGTGTTAAWAVRLLAGEFAGAEALTCVASSVGTEELARGLGLRVRALQGDDRFDLMIDGADEVAPTLELTKGGGGALLREKLLAGLSSELVIIVDHTKLVAHLGSRSAIPIEVVPFARPVVVHGLEGLGLRVRVRADPAQGEPFLTDNHNEIVDATPSEPLTDPARLDAELHRIPGVVETGLFIGRTSCVYVGRPDGEVEEIRPPGHREPTPVRHPGARQA